jgi:hypothetical protein
MWLSVKDLATVQDARSVTPNFWLGLTHFLMLGLIPPSADGPDPNCERRFEQDYRP